MSFWVDNDLTPKIIDILKRFEPERDQELFGRPYLTSLQLAFEFGKHYTGIARMSGFEMGGKDVRSQNSLAHYIAKELKTRILTGRITEIQIAYVDAGYINRLEYLHHGAPVESGLSLNDPDLILFRLSE